MTSIQNATVQKIAITDRLNINFRRILYILIHTVQYTVHIMHSMYMPKNKNVENSAAEKKLSRFDLFTRRKREVPGPVQNAKMIFTYRGDRYGNDPDKQLRYLLGIVKNYNRQYAVMILRDNETDMSAREVLKMLNGQPVVNRITNYINFLNNFHLPEYLSYEITN